MARNLELQLKNQPISGYSQTILPLYCKVSANTVSFYYGLSAH